VISRERLTIGSIRPELLDRTIIWNHSHFERLVADYIDHHNQHRPHRSLHQRSPAAASPPSPTPPTTIAVQRTTRPDGLINNHQNAA
jgi:hypothetical protein